jgi:hypothetical protein
MKKSLPVLAIACLFSLPALAAEGSAKPPGGKEGVMMERSAGEERKGAVAAKQNSPANVAAPQAAKGAAAAGKGAAAMNKDEVVGKDAGKKK